MIPGKMVATGKAPTGKHKARIVACGNYLEKALGDQECLSAGATDARYGDQGVDPGCAMIFRKCVKPCTG